MSVLSLKLTDLINIKEPKAVKKKFELSDLDYKVVPLVVLNIVRCCLLDRFTFLDYIHSGCEVSTSLAMDFTLSNKNPTNPKSLHYLNPQILEIYD